MKFMVNWSIDQDQWLPILQKWDSMTHEQRTDGGDGVKVIGRWHDLAARTGVLIIEATDITAVHRYCGQWNPHLDMDLTPVVDDEESGPAVRAILDAQG